MADTSEPEGLTNEEHVSSSPRSSPRRTAANTNMNNTQTSEGGGGDDAGPTPHKLRSPRGRAAAVAGADNQSTDTKSSGVSGDSGGPVSTISISPKHKDPDRIKKDREREERVRLARERLEDERKKKLVELQQQQRQAQENREKQLEMRRKKIEDLRRRDVERRAEVEKRRREREIAEKSRRESLLMKAEERVARYEAWKRSGQKGAPPGGTMPTTKHLSVSTSVLYHKRNSDFSSSGVLNVSSKPDSLLALNTIPEGPRSFLAPSAPPPSRPKSVMTLSASSAGSASSSTAGVKLRENRTPRKPRPASVGTSVPSFVSLEAPKASPRSKSTDRLARERSRPRGSSSARRGEAREEDRKTADRPGAKEDEKKSVEKPGVKISRSTLDRLSTPRQLPKGGGDGKDTASTPRRESPVTRISPRKAYSTSNLAMPRKKQVKCRKKKKKSSPLGDLMSSGQKKPAVRERTPKESSAKSQQPSHGAASTGAAAASTPGNATPSTPASHTPVRVLSPTPGADEDGGSGAPPPPPPRPAPSAMEKSTGDISAEEYKAKLAEKRRQAREKAEKEAEEERKRREEQERLEEEKLRQEEEEQRRQDEEAMRLAEEARKAEEERLQRAIEAEEARKAEEAARLEQERLAKEEAERKAREEAERHEMERQEKARREEEERLERKRRLEMIMKRVKTDNAGDGSKQEPTKSLTSSPTKSVASNDASPIDPSNKGVLAISTQSITPAVSAALPVPAKPEEKEDGLDGADKGEERSQSPADRSVSPGTAPSPVSTPAPESAPALPPPSRSEEGDGLEPAEKPEPSSEMSPIVSTPRAETPENGADKPKFKSPLLQKLVEGKDDAGASPGGGPRFKSPLLQNLLGKSKVGVRIGLAQDHSVSTPNLSQLERSAQGHGDSSGARTSVLSDGMSSSMIDMGTVDSSRKEVMNRNEEKDVDTSEDSSSSSHSSPSHMSASTVVANGNTEGALMAEPEVNQQDPSDRPEPMDISGTMESSTVPGIMATSSASFWSEQDSGASFGSDDFRSAAPSSSLQVSFNGHGLTGTAQGLEDSSISMRSVESVTSSITDSATGSGSVFSSVSSLPQGQGHSGGDKDFEELIDLSISNKTSSGTPSTTSTVTLLDNSADLVNFNKLEVEEGSDGSAAVPPPIIAFEESSTIRRQDVTDLLS